MMRISQCIRKALLNSKRVVYYLVHRNRFIEYHISDSIIKPIHITPTYIKMGEHVMVYYHGRIDGISKYNNKCFTPVITLQDNVRIQQNLHLTCAESITIGENTSIASNVTITDIHHPYTDINIPIERQDIVVNPVKIGKDCKIYNNAVILPGTDIGNHVTIGANSVVKGYYPDYCVAVGIPAIIIKKYDPVMDRWRKTDRDGFFID